MSRIFKAGDIVRCVKLQTERYSEDALHLAVGKEYEVYEDSDGYGVRLVGIYGHYGSRPYNWNAEKFELVRTAEDRAKVCWTSDELWDCPA